MRNLNEQIKQIRIEAGLSPEEMLARKAFLEFSQEDAASLRALPELRQLGAYWLGLNEAPPAVSV